MDPQEIIKRLHSIYASGAGPKFTGTRLTAFNLWQLTLKVQAIGQAFADEPTVNILPRLEARLEDIQTYVNVLRNLSSLDREAVDAVAHALPDWLLEIPKKDIARRQGHL